jgi:hypothetical protein
LNSVAGSLTVPNIESRCNQLKLGHPPSQVLVGQMSGNPTNQELADQLSSGQGWPNLS